MILILFNLLHQSIKKGISPSFLRKFNIKCHKNDQKIKNLKQNKNFGLIIHKNLALSLKINTYFRKDLTLETDIFEVPETIMIDAEQYFLYFFKPNEEIKRSIFLSNTISSENNDIINIDCNIVAPYISNENFSSTIATFNNIYYDEKFSYYCSNNLTYYRIKTNEIQDITIFISDKNYQQFVFFKDIPTIIKLVVK